MKSFKFKGYINRLLNIPKRFVPKSRWTDGNRVITIIEHLNYGGSPFLMYLVEVKDLWSPLNGVEGQDYISRITLETYYEQV